MLYVYKDFLNLARRAAPFPKGGAVIHGDLLAFSDGLGGEIQDAQNALDNDRNGLTVRGKTVVGKADVGAILCSVDDEADGHARQCVLSCVVVATSAQQRALLDHPCIFTDESPFRDFFFGKKSKANYLIDEAHRCLRRQQLRLPQGAHPSAAKNFRFLGKRADPFDDLSLDSL